MPSDAEFERALRMRNCYAFKRGFYLLTALENSYHAKDPLDFTGGTFTIEQIMLQNALASLEWRETLSPDCERVYEELINTQGNPRSRRTTPSSQMCPSRRRRHASQVALTRLPGGFQGF